MPSEPRGERRELGKFTGGGVGSDGGRGWTVVSQGSEIGLSEIGGSCACGIGKPRRGSSFLSARLSELYLCVAFCFSGGRTTLARRALNAFPL